MSLFELSILWVPGLSIAVMVFLLIRLWKTNRLLRKDLIRVESEREGLANRLLPITNIESDASRLKIFMEQEKAKILDEANKIRIETEDLRQRYNKGLQTFQALQVEVSKLEENLENISYGLYQPHFTYDSSDTYKKAIQDARDQQKAMIRDRQASFCPMKWKVGGSMQEGSHMVKQNEKLVLRAFNAESEAAIANVTWNNYNVMCARINKAFEALNKLGTVLQVSLSDSYKMTRLKELQLVYEAAEKRQQERNEQRPFRAEQREEERVQHDLQREKEEAEKEESKYQKDLDRIRHDMETALESEREKMLTRIKQLESDLADAHNRKERAIAQAQLTKVGHVYIISNVGAFGEGVLKIGLTRRLDPEERVQELSGASVPFPFDIHSMIYSENAPELEARIQNRFWDKRINWVNNRKEFFRITLDEVRAELKKIGLPNEVLSIPEAKEYRQTLSVIADYLKHDSKDNIKDKGNLFPNDPFSFPDESNPSPKSPCSDERQSGAFGA